MGVRVLRHHTIGRIDLDDAVVPREYQCVTVVAPSSGRLVVPSRDRLTSASKYDQQDVGYTCIKRIGSGMVFG